ncbi:MAG: adenylate/guanylate cyclase domain-containing protein [Rhizobiales bacterium]|nr:adenylate/guanylate cyclase domain-containing protein [Hyphomicrobiales bacterium]
MSLETLEIPETFDTAQVEDWLVHAAGGIADIEELVAGLATVIDGAGLHIDRLSVGVPFLLPHILGMQVLWARGSPVERRHIPAGPDSIRQLEDSPVKAAYQDGRTTRCRISPEPQEGEYPIIADLRAEGFSDYAVLAVRFSDQTFKALTIATRAPEGFTDASLEALGGLMVNLAPVLEVRTLRYLARSLLNVYVGPTASGRVLDGEVQRGEGAQIDAVIWFCDLRGSTDLANTLEGAELIGLLNEFFGEVTSAITDHGGEVLKFIGDSVLAIFPCGERPPVGCPSVARAESAARDALQRIAALNTKMVANGGQAIGMGVALHVGRVFFGNVGGEDRLDFTVIGPAVNLASRIESLSGDTGKQLLVSEDFAKLTLGAYQALGSFHFKGIGGWQTVYVPAETGN